MAGAAVHIPLWRRAALWCLRVEVRYRPRSVSRLGGPCIVVCNHASLLDGVILALASPVPLAFAVTPRFAVDNRLTRWGLAALSRAGLGVVVPVSERRGLFGMRRLLAHLRAGRSVMIFPSGTIRAGAAAMPGYEWLRDRSGCGVLEARIVGAERWRFLASGGTRIFPRIEVTI